MTKRKLRFAPLIRVSGEAQEKLGESLATQRHQIQEAVERLGGRIPSKLVDRYTGQEHATPGYERERFARLLRDAEKGLFDAVIVADVSRWSRDNEKSQEGLKVLKKHGIRFFSLTTEHDLHNPEAEMTLGMFSVLNRYVAQTQLKKSIDNRLARLRRGWPACGSSAYGRTFDRETETWEVDPEAVEFLRTLADRYLAGESLDAMAREYRMSATTLWKRLLKKSGPEFVVTFWKPTEEGSARRRLRDSEMDRLLREHRHEAEEVGPGVREIELPELRLFLIEVPPLLPADTRERVARQAALRRKRRGPQKNKYLLKGYVFCDECGKTLTGQCQNKKAKSYRYYRHMKSKATDGRDCSARDGLRAVKADPLEEAVLLSVFAVLGNASKIREAIHAATPNAEELEEVRRELLRKEKELKAVDHRKARMIDAVADGHLVGEEIGRKKAEIEAAREAIEARMEVLRERLGDTADPAEVRHVAARLARRRARVREAMDAGEMDEMSWEEKRGLMEEFFEGRGADGRPLGVYLRPDPDYRTRKKKGVRWRFEIRGRFRLTHEGGTFPLTDGERALLTDDADAGVAAKNLKDLETNVNPRPPRG